VRAKENAGAAADGERRLSDLLRQLRVRDSGFPLSEDVPLQQTGGCQLGLSFLAKSRYVQAEPLMRRALTIDEASYGPEIDEASYGPDHPKVARDLNNLASLRYATNRLAEAEPLMRRALTIDEASYGPDHPNVARDLNNLR
jgi:tetratricopeptide (TPR) repeat protein